MHPEYPNLSADFKLDWKESPKVPVQPFAPDWKFPMLHCQLQGSDLDRFNQDLADIILDQEEKMTKYTERSAKAEKHPEYDLTSTFEDWNIFYVNHPAVETLFSYYRQAHDVFIQKLNVVHNHPLNILCWGNALRPNENSTMGEHSHQGKIEMTYMSGNYCVTADRDTSTVFDPPGFNAHHIDVQNKPGQLIMFPQWVDHFTTKFNREDDVRITVAADIDVGHFEHFRHDDETGERVHYLPFDRTPHEKARLEQKPVEDVEGVDSEVNEFVNTPLAEIQENELVFDFRDHK